jgi:hypothetical protein
MANTAWSATDLSGVTLSGSNLIATSTSASSSTTMHWARAADGQVSGKFYWEVTMTGWAGANTAAALANHSTDLTQWNAPTLLALYNNGNLYLGGNIVKSGFTGMASGAVVCIALDVGAQLAWFRIGAAGNWNANAANNPATGSGGVSIVAIGGGAINLYPAAVFTAAEAVTANFGGGAFAGVVPSGFVSGFTAGATAPNSAIATQATLEQFLAAIALAQVTQVAVEHWVTTATVTSQALVTQVALEQWANVTPPPSQQARVMMIA